ncbi:MAG TPA: DUF1345 domain-containing protein [Sphingomicrobium sp.]
MAERRAFGNMTSAPRFLAFLIILLAASVAAGRVMDSVWLSYMAGFDVAAFVFLAACIPLLGTREAAVIRKRAITNDANKTLLLIIAGIVIAVLFASIASETVGQKPEPLTKSLVIATLVLAWLFTNTLYAIHYAHLAYIAPDAGNAGLEFPGTKQPSYWDFVYFAYTLGMTFQTSDVTITDERIRRVVTVHCFAAFVFNIGVLAFTINVLGSG